jgi:hypothetical protein
MIVLGDMSAVAAMKPHRLGLLILSSLVGIASPTSRIIMPIEHLALYQCGMPIMLPFLTTIGRILFMETFTPGHGYLAWDCSGGRVCC